MKTHFNTDTIEKKKVDAENGEILGVTLMEGGDREAKGHNLFINNITLQSFTDAIGDKPTKLYYTHKFSEGLETIGTVNDVRIEGDKLVGDLSLLQSFKDNDRKRYDTLFELASNEDNADLIGISAEFINAPFTLDEGGEAVPFEGYNDDDDKDLKVYAFATEVMAFSIVAEPASTDGLFEAKYDWNGGLIKESAEETTELSSDDEIDEEEAVILYNQELEARLEKQSKELKTVVALCKELQTEVLVLKTELTTDAPYIEPHYESEKPTLLDQLNDISDSGERAQFVKANLNDLWKLRAVDNHTSNNN